MKIILKDVIYDFATIKQKLSIAFPEYKFVEKKECFLIVKKSRVIGAHIIFERNIIYVVGNIPSRIGNFLLFFIVILFGVVVPLLFYFIFIHFKMRKLEKEIVEFLRNEIKK